MENNQIAFVAPYFGTLPPHFQLWLNACAKNTDITWLLYTDDKAQWEYPANVHVNYCHLSDLKDKFQNKLGFEISLSNITKLLDFKPLFGYLFEEELRQYEAWGHVDISDTMYGNFDRFSLPFRLQQFDRLGCTGHMTIYPNTANANQRFKARSFDGPDYQTILSSPKFMNFVEMGRGSIDHIWRTNSWSTGSLDDCVADINSMSYPFHISTALPAGGVRQHNDHLIFEWNAGTLLGHELSPFGGILSREFLYVHFKRRPMPLHGGINPEHYIIAPDGFYPAPKKIDESYLRRMSVVKFPDPVWVANKRRNLREHIRKMRH